MDKIINLSVLEAIDVRHLEYFACVAKESNIRRAAEKLFMAQPPLTRHIKHLEERLGVILFDRHSKGLTLTEQGKKVLHIIAPLLAIKKATYKQLEEELTQERKNLRIGFTTAFEQEVFYQLERLLRSQYEKGLRIVREPSIKLVRDIRKGNLDYAIVALPLETQNLFLEELQYKETLVIALPSLWQKELIDAGVLLYEEQKTSLSEQRLSLKQLKDKPLFWFKREASPAFFDFIKRRFSLLSYTPELLEEPLEHDVLLARIAFAEGIGLFPKSFSSIQREGVIYYEVQEEDMMYLQAGIISVEQKDMPFLESIKNYMNSRLDQE